MTVRVEWKRRTGGHRKAHAFVDGRAICRAATLPGSPLEPCETPGLGQDVCSTCECWLPLKPPWRRDRVNTPKET